MIIKKLGKGERACRPESMIVMVCLDDKNGMMFNHRRQSQDRVLRQRVLELTKGKVLRMNQYSAGQFDAEDSSHINVSETFLSEAGNGEYCFVEDQVLLPYEPKIESLIVFRWNKVYPSDLQLDLPLGETWMLTGREEFPGYSHDVVGMEVYKR